MDEISWNITQKIGIVGISLRRMGWWGISLNTAVKNGMVGNIIEYHCEEWDGGKYHWISLWWIAWWRISLIITEKNGMVGNIIEYHCEEWDGGEYHWISLWKMGWWEYHWISLRRQGWWEISLNITVKSRVVENTIEYHCEEWYGGKYHWISLWWIGWWRISLNITEKNGMVGNIIEYHCEEWDGGNIIEYHCEKWDGGNIIEYHWEEGDGGEIPLNITVKNGMISEYYWISFCDVKLGFKCSFFMWLQNIKTQLVGTTHQQIHSKMFDSNHERFVYNRGDRWHSG